ncbi:sensor histidine kinase [Pseudonocardia sp. CA-107938]|uniref:sensor histidine kinase n=1 Tax=Pseudonocardia sp. CA-107938 TaxID=3240021 RepID=UPI003D8B5E46
MTGSALGRLGLLAPAFLGLVLLARAADAVSHPDFRYVPFVAAAFALPLWYATGLGRSVWTRWYPGLLAVQAVLSFAPFALFGSTWPSGIVGPLGGLLLLTLRAPLGQALFLLAGAADLAVRLVVGMPAVPPHAAIAWVVITYADTGLALYGLVRLTTMAAALDATRSELAAAAVVEQRLASARRLRAAVVERLDQVVVHAGAALGGAPERARQELERVGGLAREAGAEVRRTAPDAPPVPPDPAGQHTEVLAPRLARVVLLAMLVMFALLAVLNVVRRTTAVPYSSLPVIVASAVASIVIVAVQWRHSTIARPRGWPWTLALQAALIYAFYPVAEASAFSSAAFLAGSCLLLLPVRWRWIAFAAVVFSHPLLVAIAPSTPLDVRDLLPWAGYAVAVVSAWGLMVYGFSRLTTVVGELVEARAELAEVATIRERLRITRDTHDLLGLGLSAIALKSELAAAVLDTDPARARREITELLGIAVATRDDAGVVSTDPTRPALVTELRSAREILRSAGVEAHCVDAPPLPPDVDTAFATVLREAVTNVLRHSRPTRVDVQVRVDDGSATLTVANDGAPPAAADAAGQGLTNLDERLGALGGSVRAHRADGRFVLEASAPLAALTTS